LIITVSETFLFIVLSPSIYFYVVSMNQNLAFNELILLIKIVTFFFP